MLSSHIVSILTGLLSTPNAQIVPESVLAQPARFAAATSAMTIDGRLDEFSWAAASPVTRFFEVYPASAGIPVVNTEARFLFDDENVYVGIRAHDPHPAAIRAPLVRRDQISTDQDYVEVFLDTLNTRRNALVFRTNVRGVAADAQFNDDTQAPDYAPDFNFDVDTSVDSAGWTAEFQIPLSTLRYEAGNNQSWAFVIYRAYPRGDHIRMASAPIPRGTNCLLCFAGEVSGISLSTAPVPLSLTPQIAYSRSETESGLEKTLDEGACAGFDLRWQPRPDSIVDFTVTPDFSQVEADAVQLTANTRFALFLAEKRPFFLEGVDLLATPIPVIYTRTFTDPDAGARVTHRGSHDEYTALLVRDAAGGSIIEPGPVSSQLGAQESESTALIGRYRHAAGDATYGTLASVRLNDDSSQNLVLGADVVWSPSASDRFVAQLFWSQTENPNRPDLLPSWTGQNLAGSAGAFSWEHTENTWYANVSYEGFSDAFRTWNGFVPRVGVSNLGAGSGLNFYPKDSFLTRVSPSIQFTRVEQLDGTQLGGSFVPGVLVEAARGTSLTLEWHPREREITPTGLKSYDYLLASLWINPASWIASIGLSASVGDGLDASTGEVGDWRNFSASIPLRLFDRFELSTTLAHQELDSRRQEASPKRLFTETTAQANAIWHFSHKLYVQMIHQESEIARSSRNDVQPIDSRLKSRFSSLLVSYQSNWQTRFFVGVRHGVEQAGVSSPTDSTQTEAFAKLTYALSANDEIPFFRLSRRDTQESNL